jgi:2-keto-4-pentenoate hydratase/2-oxohepta-3-ene-1,7-dioic acid hydratase in catechol pathway
MKLVTFTHDGRTRAGALAGDNVVDLQAADASLPGTLLELLRAGDDAMRRAKAAAESASGGIPLTDVTLEAPIARPGKALAIGLNYRDHANETNQEIPKHPIVFAKVTTCITGPGKPIWMPRVSQLVDWEGELCFVIGKTARYVEKEDALDYVAGYMVGNDVSVRDWQFHAATWTVGKGFDSHGPIGPWLVTSDEVDPGRLQVRTWVNGELKQDSNTDQLIFDVPTLVEYLSNAFTLEPGDVVFTGTPSGVGVARNPREFLKAGDTVRIEIDGLGVLENPVTEEPSA